MASPPPPPLRVRVYYDFASSLCYVAHRVLERIAPGISALELELVWTPLDLVRLTAWRRGDTIEGLRRDNALRVARELKVPLKMPARWMDSRPANALALSCEEAPLECAFRERVFRGVYEDARALDEGDWVAKLAVELGIDVEHGSGSRGLSQLEFRTLEAAEAEVTGVPTFMLDSWPLSGIQDDQTMLALLGRFATRTRGVH